MLLYFNDMGANVCSTIRMLILQRGAAEKRGLQRSTNAGRANNEDGLFNSNILNQLETHTLVHMAKCIHST